jgi:hypothetical protein
MIQLVCGHHLPGTPLLGSTELKSCGILLVAGLPAKCRTIFFETAAAPDGDPLHPLEFLGHHSKYLPCMACVVCVRGAWGQVWLVTGTTQSSSPSSASKSPKFMPAKASVSTTTSSVEYKKVRSSTFGRAQRATCVDTTAQTKVLDIAFYQRTCGKL